MVSMWFFHIFYISSIIHRWILTYARCYPLVNKLVDPENHHFLEETIVFEPLFASPGRTKDRCQLGHWEGDRAVPGNERWATRRDTRVKHIVKHYKIYKYNSINWKRQGNNVVLIGFMWFYQSDPAKRCLKHLGLCGWQFLTESHLGTDQGRYF